MLYHCDTHDNDDWKCQPIRFQNIEIDEQTKNKRKYHTLIMIVIIIFGLIATGFIIYFLTRK